MLHLEDEYTLTDLARQLSVPLITLQREVHRLVEADILRDRTVGRARLVRANTNNPAAAPLTRLLEVTFGPQSVIQEEFAVRGVEHVFLFGSWAERYKGTRGAPPNDVDVLVVGTVARTDVYDAADRAAARLGMQVNAVVRSPQQWEEGADPLVSQIKASEAVDVTPERDNSRTGGQRARARSNGS